MNNHLAYQLAQKAIADLKTSIFILLSESNEKELTNAEIGRSLGVYHGHIGHEGHIPRTLLGLMEQEGVVEQNSDSKKWRLK